MGSILQCILYGGLDDADAARILTRVAEATGPSGRVVVVESEQTAVPRDELTVSADLLMAALTRGGRERGTDRFAEVGRGSADEA